VLQQIHPMTFGQAIQRRWFGFIFFLLLFCGVALAQDAKLDPKTVERAKRYEPYFAVAAEKYGVDARLLWVIGYLETRFNPNAVSRKGARGLMQLMPATAERYGVSDPHEPIAAIDAAARYVRSLIDRFGNRADLILAAYNAGEEVVGAYRTGQTIQAGSKIINPDRKITGGIPPYRETQTYVMKGLNLLKIFGDVSASIHLMGSANSQNLSARKKSSEKTLSPKVPMQKSISYSATANISVVPSSQRLSISYDHR
jgi:hypothetical protein